MRMGSKSYLQGVCHIENQLHLWGLDQNGISQKYRTVPEPVAPALMNELTCRGTEGPRGCDAAVVVQGSTSPVANDGNHCSHPGWPARLTLLPSLQGSEGSGLWLRQQDKEMSLVLPCQASPRRQQSVIYEALCPSTHKVCH